MKTESLIEHFASNLFLVRRYRSPWLRAAGFLCFAAILGLMVAFLHRKAEEPSAMMDGLAAQPTLACALLTGILSAVAAFMMGQPDRPRLWTLSLP